MKAWVASPRTDTEMRDHDRVMLDQNQRDREVPSGSVAYAMRNRGNFHDQTIIAKKQAGVVAYPALISTARMTLPHFSVSSAMNLPKSAG